MSETFAMLTEIKPPHGREAAYQFAGFNPTDHLRDDGSMTPSWEAAWITRMGIPLTLPYLEPDGPEIRRIAVHRKAAPSLLRALTEIKRVGLYEFLSPYGGGYVVRQSRGSSKLSMHALGLAVDFDPENNARGVPISETRFGSSGEGRAVVRLFELYGWKWGGTFPTPDAMHFQFATGC